MKYKIQSPSEEDETYIVYIDNVMVSGPKIKASTEELKQFFEGVKAYNKKEGRTVIKVFGPKSPD